MLSPFLCRPAHAIASCAFLTSTGTTVQPSILLIEEYDPLAVAIGSALKKFAPHHSVHRARTVAEAEKLAKKSEPELFIIDFDPAYSGLTEFLQGMSDAHPEARVLVLAANVSHEMASARRPTGALQFLEKPFEVSDFGAAVHALLETQAETEGNLSALSALNAADIVMLQCAGSRTVLLEAKGRNSHSGQVHLRDGQLIHAEAGRRSGIDALEEILAWPEAKVRETAKAPTRRRTIKGRWSEVFLEACQAVEAYQPRRKAPHKETAPEKPPARTGKKIVVIDDTEMLVIFVEDTLTTADAQLQITTAFNGVNGIKEVERVLPDLVLLDYSLPDLNGDEVCRRLLQNNRTALIPVLMMSGHVAEMARTAGELANVVATIEKPFLSEALVALVQKTLVEGPPPARTAKEPAKRAPAPSPTPVEAFPSPRPAPQEIASRELSSVSPTSAPPPAAPVQPMAQPRTIPAPPVEPVPQPSPAPAPMIAPALRHPTPTSVAAPVVSRELNDVVLGLFLEVVSMQLTDSLRMGAIRAKPSSSTVSLHVASPALRAALPPNGFQLGPVERDRNGRIAVLRLIPTQQPFRPLETRNAFQIGDLSVVPSNSHDRMQLTPTSNAPMTMQLLAHLQLAGVELSTNFQTKALVLQTRSNTVRVTFNSQAVEETGTICEIAEVRIDPSGRIAELLLNPIR